MRNGIDYRPPLARTSSLGLQHVLIMYTGAITVPLIIGPAIGLSTEEVSMLVNADLLVCGITTIIQAFGLGKYVGIKWPVVQGASFTAIAPMIAAANGHGIQAMYGSLIVAGIVAFVLAPVFANARPYLPPMVTGVAMVMVGFSLVGSGAGLIAGRDPSAPEYGNGEALALAGGVLLIIILLNRFARGFLNQIAVMVAVVVGTIVAVPMGLADFSGVGQGDIVAFVPPFFFGPPTFELSAIIPMVVVMALIMAESMAYIYALGEGLDQEVTPREMAAGLRVDGLGTILGGVFNAFASTTFSQNVGLVQITGVRSRYVTGAAGTILVLLGILPVVGRTVAEIPGPVIGGAAVVMFAMVAAVGMKSLRRVDYGKNHNLLIIAIATVAGVVPIAAPTFYQIIPHQLEMVIGNGIVASLIVGFLLNLLFNKPWQEHTSSFSGPVAPSAIGAGMDGAMNDAAVSGADRPKPAE